MTEIEKRLALLTGQVKELERVLDMTADYVWSHNVLVPKLVRLIPPEQAWQAAQDIQAELDMAVEAQRQSQGGDVLRNARRELLKRAAVPAPGK